MTSKINIEFYNTILRLALFVYCFGINMSENKNIEIILWSNAYSTICGTLLKNSGLIKMFGPEREVSSAFNDQNFDNIFDARGGCVIPGLIDGHTHPVWAGDRVHEFAMKVYC